MTAITALCSFLRSSVGRSFTWLLIASQPWSQPPARQPIRVDRACITSRPGTQSRLCQSRRRSCSLLAAFSCFCFVCFSTLYFSRNSSSRHSKFSLSIWTASEELLVGPPACFPLPPSAAKVRLVQRSEATPLPLESTHSRTPSKATHRTLRRPRKLAIKSRRKVRLYGSLYTKKGGWLHTPSRYQRVRVLWRPSSYLSTGTREPQRLLSLSRVHPFVHKPPPSSLHALKFIIQALSSHTHTRS